jgi:hypothetical protein
MQLTKIYGNVCFTQDYNQLIAALPKGGRVKWEKVKGIERFRNFVKHQLKNKKWQIELKLDGVLS